MSEGAKGTLNALIGGAANGNTSGEAVDWEAKYKEAQRELQSARVEQGRVKKLDEEKKALEARLAELSANQEAQSAIDALPDDLREDVPENYAKGASIIAKRAVDAALAKQSAELDQLRSQFAERAARDTAARSAAFEAKINSEYPGFLSSIGEGGDKYDAWIKYLRFNQGSVANAMQTCDFDTLAYHVGQFYRNELGVEPPSGVRGAAAPDPSALGGGLPNTASGGKVYTDAELDALFDQKEAARDRGDWSEVKRLTAEINRAQAALNAQK